MAILNATAMERDRVNLGWSARVQKCQQIFETVAVRHRSTFHYCLSRYGIVSQSLQSPADVATAHLSPCDLEREAVDQRGPMRCPGSAAAAAAPLATSHSKTRTSEHDVDAA